MFQTGLNQYIGNMFLLVSATLNFHVDFLVDFHTKSIQNYTVLILG